MVVSCGLMAMPTPPRTAPDTVSLLIICRAICRQHYDASPPVVNTPADVACRALAAADIIWRAQSFERRYGLPMILSW